jgi:hypothetical protein
VPRLPTKSDKRVLQYVDLVQQNSSFDVFWEVLWHYFHLPRDSESKESIAARELTLAIDQQLYVDFENSRTPAIILLYGAAGSGIELEQS